VPEGVTISVRVQARAARNEIVGARDGTLVVRLNAPPVEGRANEALCRLLAKRLGVGRTRVTVVRGGSSRDKLVRVEGVSEAHVERALELSFS
jgi:uncharacterized protein (TIGR00251 family)